MAQVVPLDEENASNVDIIEQDDDDDFDDEEGFHRPKNWLIRDLERFWESLTYSCLKQTMEWFLVSAQCNISLTVRPLVLLL